MSEEIEDLNEEKLEKIIEEKVEERVKSLKKDNDLENAQTNPNSENISRREFLKKAGLGTIGVGALLSPVSALNLKSESLSFADDENEYLDIFEGSVTVKNSNLTVADGNIGIGVENPSLPIEIDSNGRGIKMPSGDNESRSSSPKEGETRINTEEDYLEIYYSGKWRTISRRLDHIEAEGGTTITDIDINGAKYRVHAFELVGEHTFEITRVPDGETIDVLVVGGGGGGGAGNTVCANNWYNGGGGGAGGLVLETSKEVSEGDFQIKVGDGGSGAIAQEDNFGGKGEDSSFDSIVAKGGGGGETRHAQDNCSGDPQNMDGGSGGGRSDTDGREGYGEEDQGHDGGIGTNEQGGGGGGANEIGENATGDRGGNGGNGEDFSNYFATGFGENGWFAGGGGGGQSVDRSTTTSQSNGGKGGGGAGNDISSNTNEGRPGFKGMDNTGGGGGGGGGEDSDGTESHGGDGGSGLVLVRYSL